MANRHAIPTTEESGSYTDEKDSSRTNPTRPETSVNDGSKSKDVDDFGEKGDTDEASQGSITDHNHNRSPEQQLESGNNSEPVTKVKSRIDVNHVASIPNGGLHAWMQVVGSFFLFFNTWGIINTFGVYQTEYEIGFLTSSTPSAISWIGSIQSFLLMTVGAATGPVYDAGYFRELLWGGSFFLVFGHMMLSLCTKYWQVLLAQAFCIGGGAGALFVPGVAIISTYFNTRLAIATGLAASGSSLGGVLYPIVLHKLIPQVGFGWAVRIIGFIALATLLIPNLCMKVRVLPAAKRPLIDWTAFRSWDFMLFCVGGFVGFMGLYTIFFFSQLYAIQEHITDQNTAFYLLSILNAASVFGRILPNFIADRTGALNIIVPCAAMSGVLIFCMLAVTNVAGIVIVILFFGFFSGTFVSLPPTIIVQMTANRGLIGTRLGMCFFIVSFGVLIGSPIAGAILDARGFTSVWIFGGTLTVAGAAIMFGARVAFKGWNLMIKA
ncbi:MFS general substrate transporter [Tothia fuscella]|uniref:MFS general substrate transporter n=1 Tax=Tothia fuscella TaxID=1048955 RepID=A0A9P4NLA1_9PEZI|nr:MFS general substrate transporter [Tothia fuscella]